jgi:hypothetical protein
MRPTIDPRRVRAKPDLGAIEAPPVDAAPPPPPAAYAYAPGNIYPVGDRERELCDTASTPDWLYIGGLVALDVGSIFVSTQYLKYGVGEPARLFGTALGGLTLGATFGGTYLALPKCDPHWVSYSPREGEVRATWPLAVSLGIISGVIAAGAYGVEVGPLPQLWSTEERAAHVLLAGLSGLGGSFLPYLLPPKTWRAAKELANIRAGVSANGGFLGYAFSF